MGTTFSRSPAPSSHVDSGPPRKKHHAEATTSAPACSSLLLQLPDPALAKIWRLLGSQASQHALRATCRTTRDACTRLIDRMDLRTTCGTAPNLARAMRTVNAFPKQARLRTLVVRWRPPDSGASIPANWAALQAAQLSRLGKGCPAFGARLATLQNLHFLCVSAYKRQHDWTALDFLAFLAVCPRLKLLSIGDLRFRPARNLSALTQLDLEVTRQATREDVLATATVCPRLTALAFRTPPSAGSMAALGARRRLGATPLLPCLRSLTIHEPVGPAEADGLLAHLPPTVTHLTLTWHLSNGGGDDGGDGCGLAGSLPSLFQQLASVPECGLRSLCLQAHADEHLTYQLTEPHGVYCSRALQRLSWLRFSPGPLLSAPDVAPLSRLQHLSTLRLPYATAAHGAAELLLALPALQTLVLGVLQLQQPTSQLATAAAAAILPSTASEVPLAGTPAPPVTGNSCGSAGGAPSAGSGVGDASRLPRLLKVAQMSARDWARLTQLSPESVIICSHLTCILQRQPGVEAAHASCPSAAADGPTVLAAPAAPATLLDAAAASAVPATPGDGKHAKADEAAAVRSLHAASAALQAGKWAGTLLTLGWDSLPAAPTPALLTALGRPGTDHITGLLLERMVLDEHTLERLAAAVPRLQCLRLGGCRVEGQPWRALHRLKDLRELCICGTPVNLRALATFCVGAGQPGRELTLVLEGEYSRSEVHAAAGIMLWRLCNNFMSLCLRRPPVVVTSHSHMDTTGVPE